MTRRAAGRTLAVVAAAVVMAAGIAGWINLNAAISAPTRVMGARVEAPAPDSAVSLDGARGRVRGAAGESARNGDPGLDALREAEGGTGVWAVVVGVDDYPGSGRDLRAGVADARDMESTLDVFGVPPSQRQVLLDGAATRGAVSGALEWLASNAGPKATAVIFFSGHVREVSGDPDGDGEDVDEVMVLSDDGTISDGEVAAVLNRTPARRAWVVMAGCYGGGFDDVMAPGRVLTAAAPEGVLAYENDRFGRTYLVEYMLRRGMLAGVVTSVQDAFNAGVESMRKEYPNRLPVIFDQLGESLVLGPPALAPAPVDGPGVLKSVSVG